MSSGLFLFLFQCLLVFSHAECFDSGNCEMGMNIRQIRKALKRHWEHQHVGNATRFVAGLAPDAKFYINGEEDPAPWTDVDFVADLFDRVKYTETQALAPVTKIDTNTIITVIDWGITIKGTFEFLHIGPWQVKIQFNDEQKIQNMWSIVDGARVAELASLLAPLDADVKGSLDSLLNGLKTGNQAAVLDALHPGFSIIRNGHRDFLNWSDKEILKVVFDRIKYIDIKVDSFTDTGLRTAYAHLTFTTQLGNEAEPHVYQDAWYFAVHPSNLKITTVNSVCDNSALMAIYELVQDGLPQNMQGMGGMQGGMGMQGAPGMSQY